MQTTQNNYNYGKKFRKYTYSSIPISFCILALLVVGWSMISPSTINVSHVVNAMESDGVYAEEGSIGSVENSGVDVEDVPSTYTNVHEEKEMTSEGESRDEGSSSSSPSTTTYGMDTPTSRAASPSAALTINNGGSINTSASTTVGETAYISNTVNVQASEIKSYVLQVSYASGSTGLKSSDGKVTIGGAGGKTGTSLSNNTWGYGWGYGWGDTSVANAGLTYSTMPSAGTTANLSGNAISNNAINFTKKLVFAAKFGEDVSSGHYRASVMLSLVAEPSAVTLTKISNMQDMTSQICGNSNIGETATLKDTRDNNTYNVRKHEDGNCWMTQNLRLIGPKTLTPADSDVKSNYALAASINGKTSTSTGNTSDFSNKKSMTDQSFYRTDTLAANGVYYSWYSATASTGSSNSSGNAPSSLCPRGWKLPPSSGNGSYANFLTAANIGNSSSGVSKLTSTPYKFRLAGYVIDGTLRYDTTESRYWTSYNSSIPPAFSLYTDNYIAADTNYNYLGFFVRCVATSN